MQLHLRKKLFLLLLFVSGMSPLFSQEFIHTDAGLPHIPVIKQVQRQGGTATASHRTTTVLDLPFLDDFSYESDRPDTSLWNIHPNDDRRPGISTQKGNRVPTKGVATFDGATINGRYYEEDLGSGESDTLTSMPINLAGKTAADSIYLSFFVQRGGTGEAPEAFDSLTVMFDSSGNHEYEFIWSLLGNGASDTSFQYFHIPITEARFLHGNFRVKFIGYTSLNGELDVFHLDYVYINSGRSINDSQLNDLSTARMMKSPFHPWTAVPQKQFVSGSYGGDYEILMTNAGNPAGSAGARTTIDDPTGVNTLSGTTTTTAPSVSVSPFFAVTTVGSPFSNQGSNFTQNGAIRLTSTRTGGPDAVAQNDTLRTTYRIDSLLALDDGSSDFGYGLTTARAFCQEYEIDHVDTLVAIWINFAPTIFYNSTSGQSTGLEGKGFRLVVWDSLSVDSSLVETSGGMNVSYGSSSNEFVRYQLIREVEVPTKFYVGMRQTDGSPIGVGFDKNTSQQRIYYENNLAEFQLSNNIGALMIRPEFRSPDAPLANQQALAENVARFKVAPQPVRGNSIGVYLEEFGKYRSVELELRDLQGGLVHVWQPNNVVGRQLTLDLPVRPSQGMYLLRMKAKDQHGLIQMGVQKVIIGVE